MGAGCGTVILWSIRWRQVTSFLVLVILYPCGPLYGKYLWSYLETSAVLSFELVSSLLSFRGIIGHFRGIITCAVICFLCFRGIIIWAGILSFKLPWYYRTLPRYYHMCRYLISYVSALFSHVPVSSLLGFRSKSQFSSVWSHSSLL